MARLCAAAPARGRTIAREALLDPDRQWGFERRLNQVWVGNMKRSLAPDVPGIMPTWCSSDKNLVGTAVRRNRHRS
jgi:hypothetical protein